MDINQVINLKVSEMDLEGMIINSIEKHMEKLVEEKISDIFKSWGKVGKDFEEFLKEKVKLDFSNVKIEEYNALIVNSLSEVLAKRFAESGADIKNLVNMRILTEARKEIDFSVFEKEVTELILEDLDIDEEEFNSEWYEGISINIESENRSYCTNTTYKKITISIEEEAQFSRDKKHEGFVFHLMDGQVYHSTGDMTYLKSWSRALKYRRTIIKGI